MQYLKVNNFLAFSLHFIRVLNPLHLIHSAIKVTPCWDNFGWNISGFPFIHECFSPLRVLLRSMQCMGNTTQLGKLDIVKKMEIIEHRREDISVQNLRLSHRASP